MAKDIGRPVPPHGSGPASYQGRQWPMSPLHPVLGVESMTSKDLADLIAKLRAARDRKNLFDSPSPLTKEEAIFLLELIEKNWKG